MSNRWPALMMRETAADYCDMSPDQFDRQCPVQAVDQGWRGLRWKRAMLDDWIAQLPVKSRSRKICLDNDAAGGRNENPVGTQEERAPANDREAAEARKRKSLERIGG